MIIGATNGHLSLLAKKEARESEVPVLVPARNRYEFDSFTRLGLPFMWGDPTGH